MNKKDGFLQEFKRNRTLFFMASPAVLLVIIFAYIPMLGIILAFKNYRFDLGIFGSNWSGLDNFKFFFNSGTGFLVTKNTILYNLFNLITSQVLAMFVAIVLNEMRNKYFKKISQSIIFLPYFISWIIVGAFVYNIFNFETGTLNTILKSLHFKAVNLYNMPVAWVFIIAFFNSWKWVGYNSVIYIAAITSIDAECYEAADIDGANVFQKIKNITIPSIKPTIIIIILLNVGRILRGDFQMFYQIVGNNGQLFNTTDVIDTFVFRSLINSGDIGMTAAATFYQSFLCFVIIMVVNAIVKKIDSDYALF
ncbi:ABC transporter permease [Clostridium oryzae]|uniref:Putative multiple-sugar transport system permease YteP n=1 Tax=Clostridium oryzae TaxID=1450648 RepID=A0A1V4ITL8_9CLOT|nr:ABC transporter permease subunit [Clostridium oryzae]OPJ63378.1 putative multiple-sugar transport system permease YteP [Clostridium oryzae]